VRAYLLSHPVRVAAAALMLAVVGRLRGLDIALAGLVGASGGIVLTQMWKRIGGAWAADRPPIEDEIELRRVSAELSELRSQQP
jgi:hypothetical protein